MCVCMCVCVCVCVVVSMLQGMVMYEVLMGGCIMRCVYMYMRCGLVRMPVV